MEQDIFALIAQLNISQVGRVDFAIFVPQISMRKPLLVIECDGHNCHEQTAEQVNHDNRRDRALQRLGIPVLRFTATEIVRDSEGVAHEIVAFFKRLCSTYRLGCSAHRLKVKNPRPRP